MIGFVSVGTNDIARAGAFYDGLLAEAGKERLVDTAGFVAWGANWEETLLAVTSAADGTPATPGIGPVIALVQPSRTAVDKQHALALSLGAASDGAPDYRGEEGDQGYYAGYCRDPDGNRLCFYFLGLRT